MSGHSRVTLVDRCGTLSVDRAKEGRNVDLERAASEGEFLLDRMVDQKLCTGALDRRDAPESRISSVRPSLDEEARDQNINLGVASHPSMLVARRVALHGVETARPEPLYESLNWKPRSSSNIDNCIDVHRGARTVVMPFLKVQVHHLATSKCLPVWDQLRNVEQALP